ncbi:MAG: hypothetical protein M3256_01360 [Actinomycetota bacterium]|nr:hypothetical protein [Actinomycetota bacterium]
MNDPDPLLLKEKELATAERLQVLSTLKQSFGFLGVVIGVSIDKAYGGHLPVAHLVVAPILLCITAFLASNTNTLLMLTSHLRDVDVLLSQDRTPVPLWHASVASAMSRWGPIIRRGRFRTMNPYYLLLGVASPLALTIAVLSIYQSYIVLDHRFDVLLAVTYVVITGLSLVVVLQNLVVLAITAADNVEGIPTLTSKGL